MNKRNYADPVYKRWRLEVLTRDCKTCQMPKCKSKKRLQIHHIRKWSASPSLRYDPDNGITLCSVCHKDITGSENHYESVFMAIV